MTKNIESNNKITYKKLKESDIKQLTHIMKLAFDSDTKMHTGLEEDGPKGYDNGELLKKLIKIDNSESKVIYVDSVMAGGYTIIRDNDIYTLDMFFISPSYVSKGIGTRVWEYIENTYNEAKTWLVETPGYSTRNHHFYEKCGFKKINEKIYDDGGKSYIFIKHIKFSQVKIIEYSEDRDYQKIINSCKKEGWIKFYTSKEIEYKQSLTNSITYVAYEADQYCGYIRCITDSFFTIYCCEIIVDNEYKRKGIGTLLIEKVRSKYPTCCIDVLSDNDNFYMNNDFLLICNGMRRI